VRIVSEGMLLFGAACSFQSLIPDQLLSLT
jgi:hypothetical protein